ncbi:MAG: twin-arginine translocase TatA/TatE family subunit [Acidimicrobiales bacterium]
MFNLSGSEIVFLLVAGLVVLGPERLPGVIRGVGRTYGELRRLARGFEAEMKGTFEEPLRDLRETARDIREGFGAVDPEPSPPMRPEQSVLPPVDGVGTGPGGEVTDEPQG